MADLVIKNGLVVTPSGVIKGGVAVTGKKIVKVCSDENLPEATKKIDAKGGYVIPGFIDPHVHLGNDKQPVPFERVRDDFVTETKGAIYGGVTSFITYWCQLGSYKDNFQQFVDWGNKHSHINFGLHFAIQNEDHIDEIEDYFNMGVTSFKHFYNAYKGKTGIELGHRHTDPVMMYKTMLKLKEYGTPAVACTHCEEQDIIYYIEEQIQKTGAKDLKSYSASRPPFTEMMQMLHAMEIAKGTGAPLYIVHISIADGMEATRRAREEGYTIYAETCPHYLTHTEDDEEAIGCWGQVNTPLRTKDDNEALWRGIRNGGITNMGTDHCPYKKESKQLGGPKHDNCWSALSGIGNGMENWLPVMMTCGVNAGRITIEDMVNVCSTNNAKVFGLYPEKGIIAEGSDADIVVIDPNKEAIVDNNFYHTRSDWSIYDGWKFKGMAVDTIVNGRIMLEDGEFVGEEGIGEFIARSKK
ncbi:MAG: dihydroorotase [Lentihominibacter sp.]|jgi:dihydropyrimidinase